MSSMPPTLLTDAMRISLKAAIPVNDLVDPVLGAGIARWREVLVEEADRLAHGKFPHEQIEPLLAAGAAFWSESILISGFSDDPRAKWVIRAPITKRLLPRTGFARALAPDIPTGGPHVRVHDGHRVWKLFDAWATAERRRKEAAAEVEGAFGALIDAATTLEEVEEAWPGARAVIETMPPGREKGLADAAAKVKALMAGRPGEQASDSVAVDNDTVVE